MATGIVCMLVTPSTICVLHIHVHEEFMLMSV